MAKLYFNYCAMGSSKSLRLLALAHNLEEKNIPTIIIKPNMIQEMVIIKLFPELVYQKIVLV